MGPRVLVATFALLALVLGVPPLDPSPASAVGVPTITVSPGNLHEGDEVTVTGSGLVGNAFAMLAVCASGAVDQTACGDGYVGFVEPEVDGTFEYGFDAWVMVASGGGTFTDCRVIAACEVVLFSAGSDAIFEPVARATLDFDPGGPLLPSPTLTVSPHTDLLDGQLVAATGTFEGSGFVSLDECSPISTGRICRNVGWADVDGTFSQDVHVFAEIFSWDDMIGDYRSFDCRTAVEPCQLVAAGEHARVAVADLRFDPAGELLPPPTVTVEPAIDLTDGQRIQVAGTGFDSNSWIEIEECIPQAIGWECQSVGSGVSATDGSFADDAVVGARFPYWDEADQQQWFDCRTTVDPCQIVVQARYGRIARVDLHFDPDGELLPPPTITVEPASAIVDGSEISVHGATFTPGGSIELDLCLVGDAYKCDPGASQWLEAGSDGTFEVAVTAYGSFEMAGGSVNCRTAPGCELVARDRDRGMSATTALSFAPAPPSRGRYLDPVFTDIEVIRDVVYRTTTDVNGNTVDLMLDIYLPAGDTIEKRPAIMWMHGGWFIFGDRDQLAPYAQDSARRGYVGIALQYRLRPDITSDDLGSVVEAANDAYDDATAAVEWLEANADQYRIDPDAIIGAGYSAGATLAWNLAYLPGERGPAHPLIAAAVAISGFPFAEAEAGDPPVISFHATDDSVLPPAPARDACARAALVQAICEWHEYATGDHYVVQSQYRDITRRTYDFLADQVLTPLGYLDQRPGPSVPITIPAPSIPSTTSTTVATTGGSTTSIPGITSTSAIGARPSTTVTVVPSTSTTDGSAITEPQAPRPTRPARPARPLAARPSYAG